MHSTTYKHTDPSILHRLPKLHFRIKSLYPLTLIRTGEEMAHGDKDWMKLKGAGGMRVTKGLITEEQSQDFQRRYIEACQTNPILSASTTFINIAAK